MSSHGAEFQQLGQALQSGNVSAAQQDFAQLTQNAANAQNNPASTQSTSSPWSSEVFSNLAQSLKIQLASGTAGAQSASASGSPSQEFGALGQALQSGNLSAAQQAYAQMQQSVLNIQQTESHHHHHNHTPLQPVQAATSNTSSSSTGSGASTSTIGSTSSSTNGSNFLSSALSLFSAVA
jgi:hypothetical protein